MNNTLPNQAPLFLKLAAVMGEIGSIPKAGTNSHFNYKFVTADAVADKVRTLLSQHKVAFFAAIVGKNLVEIRKTTEKADSKTGEINRMTTISMRWVVDFEFTFADGESGACQSSLWTAEADSSDDKGINKCATAAEKYFLLKTFVVTSADEPDADADGGKQQQRPQQQQRPTPAVTPPVSATASPSSAASTGNSAERDASSNVTPLVTDATPRLLDKKLVKADTTLDMPQIGSIDMIKLLNEASKGKWVTGKNHFINLLNLLQREGDIRDGMNAAQVLEEIKKHEAQRDLEKEQQHG